MKRYEKPVVMINEELAEGVYAASGYCDGDCYNVWITSCQTPVPARNTYKYQFDGKHIANETDGHSGSGQVLTVVFNKNVTYVSCSGTYLSGSGTNTIEIKYGYTQNPSDNIGLGDLEVTAEDGLEVESLVLGCNHIKTW